MNRREQILKEILSDPELMKKYSLSDKEINDFKCAPPYSKKIVQVLSTIINAQYDKRTEQQIYNITKKIHKI